MNGWIVMALIAAGLGLMVVAFVRQSEPLWGMGILLIVAGLIWTAAVVLGSSFSVRSDLECGADRYQRNSEAYAAGRPQPC